MKKAHSILFDLDGTLLDTAPDLVAALNAVLLGHERPALSVDEARPYVSRGARGLLQRGFGLAPDALEYPAYVAEFLQYYRAALCKKTRLFEGMADLLNAFDEHQIIWGVVTNKMANLTEPLLKQMHLYDRLHVLVSGDTLPDKKPSAKPLLYACDRSGMRPEQTIYIGDDPRDIQAANAAGMISVAAAYGYYDENEDPGKWGADVVIEQPQALYALMQLSGS